MAESGAFQRRFSDLKDGLQYHLSEIVPKLYSKILISSVNRDKAMSPATPQDERAADLLKVLESKIHGEPACFYLFLRELDSCPTLRVLAVRLQETLEQVKSETRGANEREHVQEEARSAIGSVSLSCHVNQQISSLEDEFELLVYKLILLVGATSERFTKLFRSMVLAIPVKRDMKQHIPFFKENRKEIMEAHTAEEIINIMCSYCDYFNPSLIEHIIEKIGGEDFKDELKDHSEQFHELKSKLKVYLQHLNEFRVKTKLVDYVDALDLKLKSKKDTTRYPEPWFVEIKVKLGPSWEECTLEKVEKLRHSVCNEEEFNLFVMNLIRAKSGSILLIWRVLESSTSSLLRVLNSTKGEHDILEADYSTTAFTKPIEKPVSLDLDFAKSKHKSTATTEQMSRIKDPCTLVAVKVTVCYYGSTHSLIVRMPLTATVSEFKQHVCHTCNVEAGSLYSLHLGRKKVDVDTATLADLGVKANSELKVTSRNTAKRSWKNITIVVKYRSNEPFEVKLRCSSYDAHSIKSAIQNSPAIGWPIEEQILTYIDSEGRPIRAKDLSISWHSEKVLLQHVDDKKSGHDATPTTRKPQDKLYMYAKQVPSPTVTCIKKKDPKSLGQQGEDLGYSGTPSEIRKEKPKVPSHSTKVIDEDLGYNSETPPKTRKRKSQKKKAPK